MTQTTPTSSGPAQPSPKHEKGYTMTDEQTIDDGGPAYPQTNRTLWQLGLGGKSLRQHASIRLRVPNSGLDWLDEMIRQSLRNEFAGQAMVGLLAALSTEHAWGGLTEAMSEQGVPRGRPEWTIAKAAYDYADAMLANPMKPNPFADALLALRKQPTP